MTDAPHIATRMTLDEFRALPETTQPTELIEGELIVSPTPIDKHQDTETEVVLFLAESGYRRNGNLRTAPLDVYFGENVLQPDIFWVRPDSTDCALRDNYWHGAPDLVIEILSPSTEARDRGVKFDIYERFGVQEYWLLSPTLQFVEVYRRDGDSLTRVGLFNVGDTFKSQVLNGLDVPVARLFAPERQD